MAGFVLIPRITKDLPEIPDKVKKGGEIVPVNSIEEVLAHALSWYRSICAIKDKIDDISPDSAEKQGGNDDLSLKSCLKTAYK